MSSFLESSISSDLGLKIIQYLNVVDSGRLATVSKRYYYLVHQYRRLRGPELVTTCSADFSIEQLVKDCKQKIQTAPNLVLHFESGDDRNGSELQKDSLHRKSFGSDTVILSVKSPQEIQVCQPGNNGSQGKLDSNQKDALMTMNFPGASVLPFNFHFDLTTQDLDVLEHRLHYHNKSGDNKFWKGLILYSNGGSTDALIARMQKFIPDAVIVGGVCSEGHVSIPKFEKQELASMSIKQLRYLARMCISRRHLEGVVEKSELVNIIFNSFDSPIVKTYEDMAGPTSVYGVFLGGDVPIRSVVSRGVHSLLNKGGSPRSFSDLVVQETEFVKPGTEGYLFGDRGPPVHYITKIRDKTDGKVYKPMEVFTKVFAQGRFPQFMGLKRNGHDGFELSEMNNLVTQLDIFVVIADGSLEAEESLMDAEMDFFMLSGKACMEDMDRTMSMLQEQTRNEEILGAVMYTCCARGPTQSGLIPESMSDATRFAKVFPDVPCLGFYANGEFGPMALAGNENVFQSGRSAHQGCTAVFALFIVPVKDGSVFYDLDDSTENVQKFIRTKLHSGNDTSTNDMMES